MNQLQGPSSVKQKREELTSVSDSLTSNDRVVYDLIRSKKDMAIWQADMKREINLRPGDVEKSLKSLLSLNLIKDVVNIQNKRKKHYIASEFEPSSEISGGDWYKEGSLNTNFINNLKEECLMYIFKQKVFTHDGVLEWSRRNSSIISAQVTTQQIEKILNILLLDNEIMEVESTGVKDFASIPEGTICYKCKNKGSFRGEQKHASSTDIPCIVCPRISHCTVLLDGIVSPTTCVYYQKWLDFQMFHKPIPIHCFK